MKVKVFLAVMIFLATGGITNAGILKLGVIPTETPQPAENEILIMGKVLSVNEKGEENPLPNTELTIRLLIKIQQPQQRELFDTIFLTSDENGNYVGKFFNLDYQANYIIEGKYFLFQSIATPIPMHMGLKKTISYRSGWETIADNAKAGNIYKHDFKISKSNIVPPYPGPNPPSPMPTPIGNPQVPKISGTVYGQVTDEDENPLKGVVIWAIQKVPQGSPPFSRIAETDENGEYSMKLAVEEGGSTYSLVATSFVSPPKSLKNPVIKHINLAPNEKKEVDFVLGVSR